MQLPEPFKQLMGILASSEPATTAIDWDALAEKSRLSMPELLSLATVELRQWNREIALVALWRAVVSVLPAAIVERPSERCRDQVEERLSRLIGGPAVPSDVDRVMKVVKRIQRYQRLGRGGLSTSSLDLSLSTHSSILRRQSYRCTSCGYLFLSGDLEPDPSANDLPRVDSPLNQRDRSPKRLNRRAVLDHILPVYLAEDTEQNWQVLCATCNRGKSDSIVGFEGRAWFGGARIDDLSRVTSTLFYMVLRNGQVCSICARGVRQVELRIARRDAGGADLYSNLHARCKDCLVQS
jgi:5-methylcytosine-specific restriction endonuclease McrA